MSLETRELEGGGWTAVDGGRELGGISPDATWECSVCHATGGPTTTHPTTGRELPGRVACTLELTAHHFAEHRT
jgi:hypothetical protein